MEESFINIFQTLAYPVAVSILLFFAIGYSSKKMWEDVHKREDENLKLRDKFIEYLQDSHSKLTSVINENAAAAKETAIAINRFSVILEKIEKKIKEI